MSAWGNGNFQQDNALDFVYREVQQPLLRKIEKLVADPVLAQADEPDSGPIMAAVEILALLSERVGAAPPKPNEVALWRSTYLKSWDATSADVYFRKEDLDDRRSVIAATLDRLAALAKEFHNRTS